MKIFLYLSFFCSIYFESFSQCTQSISLIGTPLSQTVDAFPLAQTGLDYSSTDLLIQRPIGSLTISVASSGCSLDWQVSVQKTSIVWDSNLRLWVNKVNDGNSTDSGARISPIGTTAYQEVSTIPQTFFRGFRNRQSVQVSYKISGVSVLIPAQTYSTTVYYTISDAI